MTKHGRIVINTVLLFSLCTLANQVRASDICTKKQSGISRKYYDVDGKPNPGVIPTRTPPKYCGWTPGPKRYKHNTNPKCVAKNADYILDYMQRRLWAIARLAVLSKDVYAITGRNIYPDNYKNNRRYWFLGSNPNSMPKLITINELELPPENTTYHYSHLTSSLQFSVTREKLEDKDTTNIILTFKGTEEYADLGPDVKIVSPLGDNQTDSQFRNAIEVGEKIRMLTNVNISPDAVMYYTGHSLGGGLALHAGMLGSKYTSKTDKIIIFNSAPPNMLYGPGLDSLLYQYKIASNRIRSILIFSARKDPINSMLNFNKSALIYQSLSNTVTVTVFPYITIRDPDIHPDALFTELKSINPLLAPYHGIGAMAYSLKWMSNKLLQPPSPIPDHIAEEICEWYQP